MNSLRKELEETIIDLKILKDQILKEIELGNHRFDNMDSVISIWIKRKQNLLDENKL